MVRARRLAEAAASVNEMLYKATVSVNQVRGWSCSSASSPYHIPSYPTTPTAVPTCHPAFYQSVQAGYSMSQATKRPNRPNHPNLLPYSYLFQLVRAGRSISQTTQSLEPP